MDYPHPSPSSYQTAYSSSPALQKMNTASTNDNDIQYQQLNANGATTSSLSYSNSNNNNNNNTSSPYRNSNNNTSYNRLSSSSYSSAASNGSPLRIYSPSRRDMSSSRLNQSTGSTYSSSSSTNGGSGNKASASLYNSMNADDIFGFSSPNAKFSVQNVSAEERRRLVKQLRAEAQRMTRPPLPLSSSSSSSSLSPSNYSRYKSNHENRLSSSSLSAKYESPSKYDTKNDSRMYPVQSDTNGSFRDQMSSTMQIHDDERINKRPNVSTTAVVTAPTTQVVHHYYHHPPHAYPSQYQQQQQQPYAFPSRAAEKPSPITTQPKMIPDKAHVAISQELAELVRSAESLRMLGQELVAYAAEFGAPNPSRQLRMSDYDAEPAKERQQQQQNQSELLSSSSSLGDEAQYPVFVAETPVILLPRPDISKPNQQQQHQFVLLPEPSQSRNEGSSNPLDNSSNDINGSSNGFILLPPTISSDGPIVSSNPRRDRRLSASLVQVRNDPDFKTTDNYDAASSSVYSSPKKGNGDNDEDEDEPDFDDIETQNAEASARNTQFIIQQEAKDEPVMHEQTKAERYRALAEQAVAARERMNRDESFSVVPFGYALQETQNQSSVKGLAASTNTANEATTSTSSSSTEKSERPPPVFTKTDENAGNKDPLVPVHKEGFLMKSPSAKKWFSSGKWKSRWFKLSGRILLYLASKDSATPKGMFDLETLEVDTDPKKIGTTITPHAIMLTSYIDGKSTNGKKVTVKLCASSHSEILDWYTAIVTNVALLCSKEETSASSRTLKGLPPPDRTPKSPETIQLEDAIAKQKAKIPIPPEPEEAKFYPQYKRPPSLYQDLGVSPDASASDIKKKFYKLARDLHPDRNPNIDPAQFALISKAYDTLQDPATRASYDLAERVKEVLRRGFDCIRWIPHYPKEELAKPPKERIPNNITREWVTIYCDGPLDCLYYQPAPVESNGTLLAFEPKKERSVELRFVQKVMFAKDDQFFEKYCRPNPPEEVTYENERIIAIVGERMSFGNIYIEVDDAQTCKELIQGLRAIRCEVSVLFKQKLDEMFGKGMQ